MRKLLCLLPLFLASHQSFGAIALDGCSTPVNDSTSPGTVVAPSGINDGDVLVFHFSNANDGADGATPIDVQQSGSPIGATQYFSEQSIGRDHSVWAGYKVASSESGNYDFVWTDTGAGSVLYVCVWSGVHADVLDVAWSSAAHWSEDDYTDVTDPDPMAITTATDGAVVVYLFQNLIAAAAVTDIAPSTNYTIAAELYGATWSDSAMQYRVVATAAAEDPDSLTVTGSAATDDWAATVIALKPAAAGGVSDVITLQNLSQTVGPHQSQRLGGHLER